MSEIRIGPYDPSALTGKRVPTGGRYVLAVVRSLGLQPLPETKTLVQKWCGTGQRAGCRRRIPAAEIGVDQGTLARWERGEREPTGAMLAQVRRFLDGGGGRNARRAG